MDFSRQDALMRKTHDALERKTQQIYQDALTLERNLYRAQATKLVEALIDLGHDDVVDTILAETT